MTSRKKVLDAINRTPSEPTQAELAAKFGPVDPRIGLISRNNTVLAEVRGLLSQLSMTLMGCFPADLTTGRTHSTPPLANAYLRIQAMEQENQQAILDYFKAAKP